MVRASGRVTDVRLVQPWKALSWIVVTVLGMVMDDRLVQLRKAPLWMMVTLFGMLVTDAKLVHPEKAVPPIEVHWLLASSLNVTDVSVVSF